ncbi:uncharacterized protein LOC128724647 [Anopheles nili]|uniref:uncharacterized protein LOC128724647 n=1 Tax=Anopheles nili TaxID=185578 RepID=UPI00237C20DA|nr:uncharacterized protein LOC128724647 [Anopheles nili]
MKPAVTFCSVLGLELLLLLAATHAHTDQLLPGAANAQDPDALPISVGPPKDNTQQQPPVDGTITDGNAGKSVVVNWKLACQQLCSAGLGGPTCGSIWLRTDSTTDSSTLPVDKDTLDGVCPSLCGNGLGVSKCNCKAYKPKAQFNQHLICQAFCQVVNIQLSGCSSCDGTGQGIFGALEPIETTTPNWDELCSVFCKMGDGGTLCNCDLPPFF